MLLPSSGMLLKVSSNCSIWFKMSGNNKKRKKSRSKSEFWHWISPAVSPRYNKGMRSVISKSQYIFFNHTDEYSCYLASKLLSWLHQMSRESNVVLVWWLSVLLLHSMIFFSSFGSNYSGQDLAACNDIHFKWNEGRNSTVFCFRKKKKKEANIVLFYVSHIRNQNFIAVMVLYSKVPAIN